eukprot:jgi/Mesen1/3511/ME000197S02530
MRKASRSSLNFRKCCHLELSRLLIHLALNLEYLEAEFYFFAAYGYGLDGYNSSYNGGGPPPVGGHKGNLSAPIRAVAEMLALQEAGHIRIIREFLGKTSVPRPLIDISVTNWNKLVSTALGIKLSTPFNPYQDDLHFLIAAFALPYVGLTAYVGTNPNLVTVSGKQLLAGVLGVEGGQDAMLRTLLWTHINDKVVPYTQTVDLFTARITALRDILDGNRKLQDEPIIVAPRIGAEGRTKTNILAANGDSLSYARNGEETLRIVYSTGDAHKPGGFFPKGANGNIPGMFLGRGPYKHGHYGPLLPAASPAPHFPDTDYFQLALNLEYLEAEFYFFAAYGYGLDGYKPSYNGGGPPPVGGQKGNLSAPIRGVAEMLALQEAGHIRIIREYLGSKSVARPQIDISITNWNKLVSTALGFKLSTPFNPYQDDLHFLIAAFALPYVGLTAYVGTNPNLVTVPGKQLLAGVLGVEGGQDAMLRTLLWTHINDKVVPYTQTVDLITARITALRDILDGNSRLEDEPIIVSPPMGAEGRTKTNILAANGDSLSYARNGEETLRIVYSTGDAHKPGGFFPKGANGNIAGSFLGKGPYAHGHARPLGIGKKGL